MSKGTILISGWHKVQMQSHTYLPIRPSRPDWPRSRTAWVPTHSHRSRATPCGISESRQCSWQCHPKCSIDASAPPLHTQFEFKFPKFTVNKSPSLSLSLLSLWTPLAAWMLVVGKLGRFAAAVAVNCAAGVVSVLVTWGYALLCPLRQSSSIEFYKFTECLWALNLTRRNSLFNIQKQYGARCCCA